MTRGAMRPVMARTSSGAAPIPFAHLSRAELDQQLSPSRSAKDPWGVLARHQAVTTALDTRQDLRVTRDVAYGARPRARLDLVTPTAGGPWPCLVWIHGGFWQEGSKAGSCFPAPALAEAGWATAGVGYTLTPEVRLREIVDEIAAAVRLLVREAVAFGLDAQGLVIGGHSAGGHVAAALLTGMGGGDVAQRLAGAVLVSGVYDLAPVAASYVNDRAKIDDAEVADLSPLFVAPVRDVPVHVLVGADEPDAFRQQSQALCAAWLPCLRRLSFYSAPGRDHFDVLDELADAASPIVRALGEMCS